MGSRQFLEEWIHYKKILEDTKVTERTTWLDVRGNHGKNVKSSFGIFIKFKLKNDN